VPISHRHKKRINEIAPYKAWVLVSVPTKTDNLPHVLYGAFFLEKMKEIQLTKGYVALVDDEDFEWLSKFKWYATLQKSGRVSAVRNLLMPCGNRKKQYMHRDLMNAPLDKFVDHIDGNALNNCRANLRLCTNAENQRNRGKNKNNITGYCGVSKKRNGFRAQITVNRKQLYFGTYATIEEAARVYDIAAIKYHGEFAKTNF